MKRVLLTLGIVMISGMAAMAANLSRRDNVPPTIDVDEPKPNAQLIIGQPNGVNFEAEFEDNWGVRTYRVVFKAATDTEAAAGQGEVLFQYDNTWKLPNRREVEVRHHEVKIPAGVRPGRYHMVVYCTDRSGNEEHTVVPVELVKI